MLSLFVVNEEAHGRTALVESLSAFLQESQSELEYIPNIDLQPMAFEEVLHRERPDLIVLGSELVEKDAVKISTLRKRFDSVPILVVLNESLDRLGAIEQLARLGADDTLSPHFGGRDFLKKLVLLTRKSRHSSKAGSLIVVDSGKGGVGVTSVTAALAESNAKAGRKTLCIDFDTESQDLSRFLQARPYVNENLQHLLEGSRPVTRELVEQVFSPAWGEGEQFLCMSPPKPGETSQGFLARNLLSILEILDSLFDVVIVDLAGQRGVFERAFYRAADKVLFVVNSDPAALYASLERYRQIEEQLSPDTEMVICSNETRGGVSQAVLLREFGRAIQRDQNWDSFTIPYSQAGSRWAASGGTVYSLGGRTSQRSFERLSRKLEIDESKEARGESASRGFGSLFERYRKLRGKAVEMPNSDARLALPETTSKEPNLPSVAAPKASPIAKQPTHDFPLVSRATVKSEVPLSEATEQPNFEGFTRAKAVGE